MGFSFSDDVGDGAQTTFIFAFVGPNNGYFDEDNIQVTVDGLPVAFELSGPNQITITGTAPALGAAVRIRRVQNKNAPYTDFERGNNFGKQNLNRSFNQQLFVSHEFLDGFKPDGYYEKQDLSIGNNKITDLADAVNPQDAATLFQLDDRIPSSFQYLVDAEAARDAAQVAQAGAELAEDGAEAAEDQALISEINAAGWEDKAEQWAEEDEDVEVEPGKYSAKHHRIKIENLNPVEQTNDTGDGAALLPVGSIAERPGLPASGMFRFNDETGSFEGYNGSAWAGVGGASGGPGNPFIYENDKVVTEDYTLVAAQNGMTAGPIEIADGVTVTIEDGATWTIV